MIPRSLVAVFMIGWAVGSLCASDSAKIGDSPQASARTNAQNYRDMLLAGCIARAYESETSAFKDANSTADVLREWTLYDAENSPEEIDSLLTRFLSRDYRNPLAEYQGVRFGLLKCLDMYHSKDLDVQVKRFVLKPNLIYENEP